MLLRGIPQSMLRKPKYPPSTAASQPARFVDAILTPDLKLFRAALSGAAPSNLGTSTGFAFWASRGTSPRMDFVDKAAKSKLVDIRSVRSNASPVRLEPCAQAVAFSGAGSLVRFRAESLRLTEGTRPFVWRADMSGRSSFQSVYKSSTSQQQFAGKGRTSEGKDETCQG